MPRATVAGPRARSTVHAAAADGAGPAVLRGTNVPEDADARTPKAGSGETAQDPSARDAAAPRSRRRVPRAAPPGAAPTASFRAAAPRASAPGAPRTGRRPAVAPRASAPGLPRTVSAPAAVPRAGVRAARRDSGAVRTRTPAAAAGRRRADRVIPVTAAVTVRTPHAPRAAAPRGAAHAPPAAAEAGAAAAAADAVTRSRTTAPGSSASCPRRGSPPWSPSA